MEKVNEKNEKQVNYVITKVEDKNSVEFGINAKGLWTAKIKVYANKVEDAFGTAEQLAFSAELLLDKKNHPEKFKIDLNEVSE